jgi:hypothetical protein
MDMLEFVNVLLTLMLARTIIAQPCSVAMEACKRKLLAIVEDTVLCSIKDCAVAASGCVIVSGDYGNNGCSKWLDECRILSNYSRSSLVCSEDANMADGNLHLTSFICMYGNTIF